MSESGILKLSAHEHDVIRATYCALADELREHHPKVTVPQIKRTLRNELDNSI